MAGLVETCTVRAVGRDNVVSPESIMGGGDMAFFLEKAKGCYIFLCTGRPGCLPLHNAGFNFDEQVLLTEGGFSVRRH